MRLNFGHFLVVAAFVVGSGSRAETLQRSTVPANTKWVLHLDVDALRKSKIGQGIMGGVVSDQAEAVKERANLDLPGIIQGTHSITIYGADYESGSEGKGILLWKGNPEIERIANAFLIQQAEATKAGEGNIALVQKQPFPIYTIDGDMHAAVISGKGLILGRSADQIKAAARVLNGDRGSLANSKAFTEFPKLSGGFFLMAFAESFGENTHVPAQAQVLKLAEGGRIAIGEQNQNLMLQLILNARSKDVTQQIQQVIQGMVALATLGLGDDPELQKIVRATQVTVDGLQVKLDLTIPLDEAVKQIEKRQASESK